MRRKTVFGIIATLLFISLLVAWKASEAEESPIKNRGALIIARGGEPWTFEPTMAWDFVSIEAC